MDKQRYFEVKKGCRKMPPLRRSYIVRLTGRCAVLTGCVFLGILRPSAFELLEGLNFFDSFSVLHILWGIWMTDMLWQLIPENSRVPLGSQKLFRKRFVPADGKSNDPQLREYIISTTKAAYRVFILWAVLIAVIGMLFYIHVIDDRALFLICVFFYVCDLICVLIWCPFRLIMKNRCCTTCRIFNWDHLMMFSPLIFMGGFYGMSLVLTAFAVWMVWELCVMLFPERFWEVSNEALKCSNCTDKLCTQYCEKRRRKRG